MPKVFPQQEEENFGLIQLFKSYVSKPEVTSIGPSFLMKGSQNVLIDYAQRVISRNGYKLYNQANTGAGGTKGSYEWETSSGPRFSLRAYDRTLQFDWNGAYNTLLSVLPSAYLEFAKVLDFNEQQDVLLFVLGESSIRRWSGGASKAWKSTTTTVTKQGVLGPNFLGNMTVTLATPGIVTLTAHGLSVGDQVNFTGGVLPTGLTAGTIYYVVAANFTANTFSVSATNGGAAINTSGSTSGTIRAFKLNNSLGITFSAGTAGTVPARILDTNSNFVNAGFAPGDVINVTGTTNNNGNYTVGFVSSGVLTLIMSNILTNETPTSPVTIYNQTGPTWKSARFFSTISGRAITYQGTSYTYTDGETTDTLVGLTAFPTVAVGDATWQTPDIIALPSGITATFPNFFPNLIGSQLNMIFLASTTSQMVFGSAADDYTNFTLTSPRAQGDPMQEPLTSGPATCIVPVDGDSDVLNITNTLVFGSGIDALDQIDFHMSQDNTEELLRIIRYKTAEGSGVISKSAVCPIKNNTIYISNEPALDVFNRAAFEAPDGQKNVPISDPIKDDFDSYDFTDCHVRYWKRSIYIALPAHGLVLIYDMMRGLWQPPQTIPVGRFAIINDQLYGHSSITNETYRLFVGTDDNGIGITQIARFAYNNGGARAMIKNLSTYWTDGYMTANGLLTLNIYYGFDGIEGMRTMTIAGNDEAIATSIDATPLGNEPLGVVPLGGDGFNAVGGLPGAGIPLSQFWQEDTVDAIDYVQHFVEYVMTTQGGQFAIVAHGSDQYNTGTAAISHKK